MASQPLERLSLMLSPLVAAAAHASARQKGLEEAKRRRRPLRLLIPFPMEKGIQEHDRYAEVVVHFLVCDLNLVRILGPRSLLSKSLNGFLSYRAMP